MESKTSEEKVRDDDDDFERDYKSEKLINRIRNSEKSEEKMISASSKKRSESKKSDIRFESKLEDEVDEEFNNLKLKPNVGSVEISQDPEAKKIALGLRINSINMRDGKTGRLIWESSKWESDMFEKEYQENIPKEILSCRTVSREINFSSIELMEKFRVYYRGTCIEEWSFRFGFVMPGSTNSWQQVIEAAPPEKMMTATQLSGNVTFETSFYDGPMFICKNLFRIYYV